eukprot:1744193-Rhodomonas_salina.1
MNPPQAPLPGSFQRDELVRPLKVAIYTHFGNQSSDKSMAVGARVGVVGFHTVTLSFRLLWIRQKRGCHS